MRNTSPLNECLHKGKCYVDRTVDPPAIRKVEDKEDFEIIGWVWLTIDGELRTNGVDVKVDDGYIIHNNERYPPGLYYLIRKDGREFLVSERFLKTL